MVDTEHIIDLEHERITLVCELDQCWLEKKSLVEYELIEQRLCKTEEYLRRLRKQFYTDKVTRCNLTGQGVQ